MTVRAGELRPSQAVTQSGPGSLVDLPTLSMVMAGIDDWNASTARRVDEPRLARRLRVDTFREPPFFRWADGSGGLPARIFPRFLTCPRCNRLAPHDRFEFDPRGPRHLCKATDCRGGGNSVAYPSRYMVACPRGHLSDFPWHAYVHPPGVACSEDLRLEDTGRTGAITDIWVKCEKHGASKNLGQAFGVAGRKRLPRCSAERPWFDDDDPDGCSEESRVLLRGASNAYFPIVESAISIPPWSDPVQLAVGGYFDQLAKVDSREKFNLWLSMSNVPDLDGFLPDQLWAAISRRRAGDETIVSLKEEEWRAFQTGSLKIDPRSEFKARQGVRPESLEGWIEHLILIERLREVRALRGFTRIDPIPDVGDLDEVEAVRAGLAPIRKVITGWLPGVEFRGEGILVQLDEDRLRNWENTAAVKEYAGRLAQADGRWHSDRGLAVHASRTPRFVLLHTLGHLLIRQLALDCGYSAASLRERIYSTQPGSLPMAGILVYTATPDAEGSLGGLVEQGRPETFGPLVERALFDTQLCANDPLCADRALGESGHLNGSACHACLLVSETACESGNHYLDRGVLVPTVSDAAHAFFRG
jgi:Domain of unknown function (DUF1998)